MVPFFHDVIYGALTTWVDDSIAVFIVRKCVVEDGLSGAVDGIRHRATSALEGGHTVVHFAPSAIDGSLKGEPFGWLDVHVHLTRVALVPLSFLSTLVVQVTEGSVCLHLVRTSTHCEGVLLRECGLSYVVGPVGVFHFRCIPSVTRPSVHDVVVEGRVEGSGLTEESCVLSLSRFHWVGVCGWVSIVLCPAGELDEISCAHRW